MGQNTVRANGNKGYFHKITFNPYSLGKELRPKIIYQIYPAGAP
jgi:hypothetical protein